MIYPPTGMRRFVDWRLRLSVALEERKRMVYVPGSFDRALFAADCIYAITGTDIALTYRGKYRSVQAGIKAIRLSGYADLSAVLADCLPEYPNPAAAVVGDVAIIAVDDEAGWNCGVVNGERVFVLRPDGLGTVSRGLVSRAFRVG